MSAGQFELLPIERRSLPVPLGEADDIRIALFREGLTIIRSLIGKGEQASRRFLCKLLRDTKDDCSMLLAILREAKDLRPLDASAWLSAAVRARAQRRSALDQIAEDWQLPSLDEMDARAAASVEHNR